MPMLLMKGRRFLRDESGAVTVDWVALTAAVVVIGIGLTYAVFGDAQSGIGGLVTNLTNELTQAATNLEDAVPNKLPDPAGKP
ncbi:MAG: Flp family type IVb pilin [Pikeienuella sp.]